MKAGVARVIDDDTGLVHWAYFAEEVYDKVHKQIEALVISTTLCIISSTRLARGKQVTCIACMAKYVVTYSSTMPVIDE